MSFAPLSGTTGNREERAAAQNPRKVSFKEPGRRKILVGCRLKSLEGAKSSKGVV